MTHTRRSDTPSPGFYLLRLVRGGPWVGACIAHGPDGWTVMVDGETQGPAQDPWSLSNMERVHYYGRATTESEVAYRVGVRRWAEIYDPGHRAANPRRPVDIDTIVPF